MKINKRQANAMTFILVPVYILGSGFLIWEYFFNKISGEMAKSILCIILFFGSIYLLERFGKKIVID